MVDILFRILKKYQPGGLAERTHVLKQLVEGNACIRRRHGESASALDEMVQEGEGAEDRYARCNASHGGFWIGWDSLWSVYPLNVSMCLPPQHCPCSSSSRYYANSGWCTGFCRDSSR